ncbi:uncharacterized protein LOC119336156 [Triticum dicoccoides]|uniref:DUF659 domain-containing protein n=1 Tax=Triticum turgidum subsp. durum TaxID=4567 RepID=A0A9R1A3I1_TRITD|nr:uncharacterized protein LOC119336156 [Triticum dicoccoides]VAI88256.1 unnamed protein product [Triticum turgidum subsp. durum]
MESGSDDGSNSSSSSCAPGIAALRSGRTVAGGKNKSAPSRRQRVTTDLSIYSDLSCRRAPAPPRLQGVLQKDSAKELGQAWAKFFHANGIPGEKADCPHFQEAMRLTQQLGPVVQHVPTGSEIDGPCLQSEYDELMERVAEWKGWWDLYGVTVMCDSWIGPTGTTIVNFMISCNRRMYFHKSVDATGSMQSIPYLYELIRKVVVEEIGQGFVVQIVTQNESNFKEACGQLIKEYPHIVWQPCAAHTVNLMLMEIGNIPKVDAVLSSAKQICRFFYSYSEPLHAQMKTKIGGELIPPNAARFGTDFMCLQSYWDNKDKLRQWMISNEWEDGPWSREADYDYTYDCLTSCSWWEDVKWVLDRIRPLYAILQHADSPKTRSISGFMPRMIAARDELQSLFQEGSEDLNDFMDVVDRRVADIYDGTLMIAAGVLDPDAHYKHDLASNADYMQAFTMAIEKVADSPANAVAALDQFETFRSSSGRFDKDIARRCASTLDPASWWSYFGGEVKLLQGYATRIVSRCMSSSRCERNWSTYALMHAQATNQLASEKLHKLVCVRYNLNLRFEQSKTDKEEKDGKGKKELDLCRLMMDVALYDKENPIMDWLKNPGSASLTSLDEKDECDLPTPSRAVIGMICKGKSSEDVLDKPIGVLELKKNCTLSSRKQKRKRGKMATDNNGSLHRMSTRKKTKDLSSL